jgi:hypothetical protein
MKQLVILLLLLATGGMLQAQHPGFSKRYRYSADTTPRAEFVSALTYDTVNRNFLFCSSGLLIPSNTYYTTFYKTDEQGNVLKEMIDSMYYGNVTYNCVMESADGYLYWAGNSFVYQDTASICWKIRKTDKDLNVIWDRLYRSPNAVNMSVNLKPFDRERLMLLCFDYTDANSLGIPEKRSTPLMRIIDSAGAIISDHRPLELNYTNAIGLERTNDGGFMVNGNSDWKAYILKTDSTGNPLWHHFYGNDASRSWFNNMRRQNTATEFYLNAGGIIANSNNDGISFASKTNNTGDEIWQKRIIKNGTADEFFDVANGNNLNAAFVGSSYFPEQQFARGWIVKMDKDGNERWNKLYTTPHPADYHDYLYRVISLPDGGFAAAGSTFAQDTNGYWTQHAWLLRVDSNGCYNPACTDFTAVKPVIAPTETISLFPNPSPGLVHLIKTSPFPSGTTVTLTDVVGKMLRTLESPAGKTQQVYQLRGTLLPGVYFIKITMDGQVVEKKLILTF